MEERMINGRRCFVEDLPDDVEVERVALRMLEQNEIKGLFPFRLVQNDARRQLRYDAQWGNSFEEWIGKVHGRRDVMELTESLLETAQEADHYLLEADRFCTREAYLRIEGNQCRIAYLPLADYREGDILKLVHRIWEQINYAMDEDYTYIFQLLNAFGGGEIREIADLQRWMRMLENGEDQSERMRPKRMQSDQAAPEGMEKRQVPFQNQMFLEPEEAVNATANANTKAEKETGKKHHLFGVRKKKETGIGSEVQMESVRTVQNISKKYYNEIKDNGATMIVDAEKKGYLVCKSTGQEYLLENRAFVIGSSRQADIPVSNNSAVSRRHAEIGQDSSGSYYIRDLNSTNGTYVAGERLVPEKTRLLDGTARIKLANEEFNFELRRR